MSEVMLTVLYMIFGFGVAGISVLIVMIISDFFGLFDPIFDDLEP